MSLNPREIPIGEIVSLTCGCVLRRCEDIGEDIKVRLSDAGLGGTGVKNTDPNHENAWFRITSECDVLTDEQHKGCDCSSAEIRHGVFYTRAGWSDRLYYDPLASALEGHF